MQLRQNLNIEYLKNIVLSFLEASQREALIPVLVQVLQLAPEEEMRLRKATGNASLLPPKSSFGFF